MPAVDVKEDDQLGQKVTDIFSDLYINISKPDIDEDCHQLGKSNTVFRFINCNVCKDALKKKYEVKTLIDNSKLGFKREKKPFICVSFTPCNQYLAWMWRELKRAKKV